jgi:hypothetical protein
MNSRRRIRNSLKLQLQRAYRGRGTLGTSTAERWRGGKRSEGPIARQAAGDVPAPVGAAEAQGRPDRCTGASLLPMIGAQMGLDLNVVSQSIATVTGAAIAAILWITGHT